MNGIYTCIASLSQSNDRIDPRCNRSGSRWLPRCIRHPRENQRRRDRVAKVPASRERARLQRFAVRSFVVDQAVGFRTRWTTILPGNRDLIQRLFDERDFRGGRRAKVVSQRNTFAVDHHHPLRTIAPAGFVDCGVPFWAEAKLPSMKHSLHTNCLRSSSWARYAR